MRLEKQKDPAATRITRGADHRGDLRRMMPVVVDEHMKVRGMQHFETPTRAPETFQRGRAPAHVEAQLGGEGQHRGRIDHIVLPRNIKGDPRQLLALPTERKSRGKARGPDIGASISAGLPVGDSLGATRTNPHRSGIVGTIENFSRRLVEQLTERRVNRRQIGIVVEVLGLDIEHDDVFRMVKDDRAVALIALGHKILPSRIPACVRAEDRDFRANIVRRMRARGTQGMRRHGRNGCLAMHPRDQNSFFPQHEGRQRLRAPHHGLAHPSRRVEGRITFANGRGINDQLSLDHVIGPLRSMEIQTERLQPFDFHGIHLVRSADPVAEGE